MKKSVSLLLTLLCAASTSAAPLAHIVVDERFADRNRTTQNPPESLEWFASVPVNTNVRGTYLHLTARRDGSREVAAHFPEVKLAAGETLILEFDFHFGIEPVNNDTGFSFGLFNASAKKSNRITADEYSQTDNESEGYAIFINPRAKDANAAFSLINRSGKGSLLPQSIARRDRVGSTTALDAPLHNNRSYHVDLRLQRDADGKLQISFELSGGGIPSARIYSFNPTGSTQDSFDTVAFRITRPGISDIYLSNISVVHEAQPTSR